MDNEYLYIKCNTVNYQDNVFSGIAHFDTRENFIEFCIKRANDWRNSELGNYDSFTQSQREIIAERWESAKNLEEGEYDYYFNLEDKNETFKRIVQNLAEQLGINYELNLKNHV